VYFAPVGDPALGPGRFPCASASELTQATLGHHGRISHIANEVIYSRDFHGIFRLEASGFQGRRPNENRWMGICDLGANRLLVFPPVQFRPRRMDGAVFGGRLIIPKRSKDEGILWCGRPPP